MLFTKMEQQNWFEFDIDLRKDQGSGLQRRLAKLKAGMI